jgi:hypothetical protein
MMEIGSVLWIRIGFNADPDPDPAFYLNADPDTDPDPRSQTNADPDPGLTFKSQKVGFFIRKIYLKWLAF